MQKLIFNPNFSKHFNGQIYCFIANDSHMVKNPFETVHLACKLPKASCTSELTGIYIESYYHSDVL